MLQRLITLTVWALVGWTAMALGLRLLPAPLTAPAGALALAPESPPPAQLTRLFGAAPVQTSAAAPLPAADSRFRLLGIVAPRLASLQTEQGVALITVDGGPPKAFRVGDVVDGAMRLLAVERHAVGLGQGGVIQVQLQLQAPPEAATGQLPPAAQLAVQPPPLQRALPPATAPVSPSVPMPTMGLLQRGSDEPGPQRVPPSLTPVPPSPSMSPSPSHSPSHSGSPSGLPSR